MRTLLALLLVCRGSELFYLLHPACLPFVAKQSVERREQPRSVAMKNEA